MEVEMSVEAFAFIGIFLGALSRTIFPYLKKLKKAADSGVPIKFALRYLLSMIISMILSLFTAALATPSFDIPSANIFFLAFAYGWAANDVMNMVMN